MKKLFFLFTMLISVAASATVTVTPLTADYNAKTVSFRVTYANAYGNKVWIWIDFCPVAGVKPAGSFSPATITSAATVSGSGTISGLNGRGFFLGGNATNSGTTVTATLSPAPTGQFNWCVYGSDYPPNAAAYSSGTYILKGTRPFIVNGNAISGNQFAGVINTLTDPTGYPGCIGRDVKATNLPCCASLTAANGVCRDLEADNAFLVGTVECRHFGTPSYSACSSIAGWSMATATQIDAVCTKGRCYGAWEVSQYGMVCVCNIDCQSSGVYWNCYVRPDGDQCYQCGINCLKCR
jgi:hypothetical protein